MLSQRIKGKSAGILMALTSALAFGGSGTFAKPLINAGIDPLHVTWLRLAGAALLMLPLAIRYSHLLRSHLRLLLGYGLFAMAGVQAFYFAAIARIPVGVALLIEFLGPVLVLGWVTLVRRQRVPAAATVGVVLCLVGLTGLLEVWTGMRLDVLGLTLALAAAGCQAGFFLLSDAGGDDVNPLGLISLGTLIALAATTVLTQPWQLPWTLLTGEVEFAGTVTSAMLLVVWLGLVSTGIAYLSGVAAVRLLSPPIAGAVGYLECVTALALAWLMLGEALSLMQLVGAAIIIAGAYIAQTSTPDERATRSLQAA